ncbi:DUF2344 domain-containing protein [Clostridiales bacterium NSJ-40]|uniref:DUF2344 domain-containing protein n=2 Tax=Yeguia hominis TaxID=2763662 RepID=A0A926D4W3_9FIRM|nr:DUF2344 domain-containing protein [Yeguia hominis]
MMLPKRLWFSKEGPAKYISHLDLNRYFARVFRKAKLPLWYTEGFNPHPFMVFTLPLSLGMTGKRESLDIRLTEEMEKEEILRRLNASLAAGMHFFDVTEPLKKAGDVAYAAYTVFYDPEEGTPEALEKSAEALCKAPQVIVEKRSKSGAKPFDLAPYLQDAVVKSVPDGVQVSMMLPAGSRENVSPKLFGEALRASCGIAFAESIARVEMYDTDRAIFR